MLTIYTNLKDDRDMYMIFEIVTKLGADEYLTKYTKDDNLCSPDIVVPLGNVRLVIQEEINDAENSN